MSRPRPRLPRLALRALGLCGVLVWTLSGSTTSASSAGMRAEHPLRVLIVGNSYTRFNVLPHLLQRLSAGVQGGVRLHVDAEARNGYSLRTHLRAGEAMARIRSGHYGYVVLQGHSLSAIDHPAELAKDAERFKRVIDATHGRTVLYETWARHPSARLYRKHPLVHSFGEMAARVDATYTQLAQHTGAELAPVGSAFERALANDPDLRLWGPDGSHPTLAGSFLAACVLYATITNEDPRLSGYVPRGMPREHAELIKEIAAQTSLALRAQAMAAAPPPNPLAAAQAGP